MYVLYVDHSGEIANPKEKYFIMAGAAVFERQIYHLEQELQQIQQEYLPETTGKIEFHAAPMRNRTRPPWNQMPRERVQELMTAIYDCISRAHVRGFCLFGEAIEKSKVVPDFNKSITQALQEKKEAKRRSRTERGHEKAKWKERRTEAAALLKQLTSQVIDAAFERLCTQFEFFLRRFYVDKPEQQQRGMIVFDHASYERDVELLMDSFHKHGTGVTPVYNVVETPFFADSSSTRFLQLADFVSYALYRRYESGDTVYFDKIAHRFDERDGVYHGLVHYTSELHCMCPACLTRKVTKQAH